MVNIIEGRRQKAEGRRQEAGGRRQEAVIMKKIFSPLCTKIPFSASSRPHISFKSGGKNTF
ncbi:MAG: hypothetical protein F6J86_01920 [Symploca sp. SIO1B1]|nr:hypothetical protein [Symploca sp. SIO1B1]